MAIGKACLACGRRIDATGSCSSCDGARYRIRSSCIECGQRATSGPFCETHRPRPAERTRAAYRDGYRDPRYHRERQAALTRSRGACERCGAAGPLEVDHIVPLRDGGANTRSNLQVLCQPCHRAKTASDRRRRA